MSPAIPAVSLPCGLADGLPVGLQLVMARNEDERLLDLAEDVEEAIAFDWCPTGASGTAAGTAAGTAVGGGGGVVSGRVVTSSRDGALEVILKHTRRRNALSRAVLPELHRAMDGAAARGSMAEPAGNAVIRASCLRI